MTVPLEVSWGPKDRSPGEANRGNNKFDASLRRRMPTKAMRRYRLARSPVDTGSYKVERHAGMSQDIRAAILRGA